MNQPIRLVFIRVVLTDLAVLSNTRLELVSTACGTMLPFELGYSAGLLLFFLRFSACLTVSFLALTDSIFLKLRLTDFVTSLGLTTIIVFSLSDSHSSMMGSLILIVSILGISTLSLLVLEFVLTLDTLVIVSAPLNTDGLSKAFNDGEPSYLDNPLMPHLKDIYGRSERIFTNSTYDDEGVVTDSNNLETTMNVSLTPTTRIHTIHPKTQILRDPMSAVQIRSKVNKNFEAHALEEIDYDEVFAPMTRIEAIRIFLAFASYMGFILYQIDVKSAFLYGTINEEVYVSQPPGFVDPKFPNKVYKVVKALYGLHQAPRAWYATLSTFLEKSVYRRGAIDKTLFIKQDKKDIMLVQVYVDDIIFGSTKKSWFKQKEDGIFISQDKYVAKILKKFDFLSVKTASTPIETQKPLVKDKEAVDMDVHLYRFQVTPKTSHLQAMKRIFRYLKGQPKLGLWYPKLSSFDLEAYSDSDYAGANLDRKSTTGVFHSKTKHIEIQHHFIRGAYEKKLIQVLKIHIDDNVADLLTKAFDVSSKELASPRKMALGKDKSNPFIAGSLSKTKWHFITVVSYKLMLFSLTKDVVVQLMLLGFDQVIDFLNIQVIRKKVVVTEDVIRQDLHLDDADGVECLPNEEIFAELARMGYEKPPPKLTFYKAFFFAQWKFLIHTLVQCVSAKENCVERIQLFNGVCCHLPARMGYEKPPPKLTFYKAFFFAQWKFLIHTLVQCVSAKENCVERIQLFNGVCCHLPCYRVGKGFSGVETPLFASMLVQPQPQATEEEEEVELEQDKISQALEILKLKKRVKKLENKRRTKSSGLKRGEIEAIDADKDITLVDVETQEKVADLGAELQGRKYDNSAAIKDVNVAEPTVFVDEEEVEQAAAREKHEKDDLERAKVLQQQKPISIAQARKNMIIYLKNMAGYKMEHFRGMTYDKESFKKLKAVEVLCSKSTQDTPTNDPKEMSEEDVQKGLKLSQYLSLKLKLYKVSGITEAYQSFKDMLKGFDREDLDALWRLVKEKLSSTVPNVDKEKALWVEFKRLFEPDTDDVLWKLQRYMHYPIIWKLYSNCGVYQVSSTTRRHDIFMLIEKVIPCQMEL
nr:retrovirus-related Pol polyprotein from transposon TNT 1-94 [Tanacetum cinerariifolium]